MTINSFKTKKYLFAIAKVLLLGITFGYIFYTVSNNKALDFGEFITASFSKGIVSGYLILLFLLFASANWYFEIRKWQILVSSFKKIDFKTAMKQSLASLTISLATPIRIGEYGAKTLFFESHNRKKAVLLNFYSRAIQMFVTSLFGIIGLIYLIQKFNLSFSYERLLILGFIILLILGIGYLLKKKKFLLKDFSIAKTFRFFKEILFSVKLKTFVFSEVRYVIFSSLFFGLFALLALLGSFYVVTYQPIKR